MIIFWQVFSVAAIVAGGSLSAFTASRSSRATAWLSAYLVIVMGVLSWGLVSGFYWLELERDGWLSLVMMIFTLGNSLVMLGTWRKYQGRQPGALVKSGCALLLVAMGLYLWGLWPLAFSWQMVGILAVVLIVVLGLSVGLVMSMRRQVSTD